MLFLSTQFLDKELRRVFFTSIRKVPCEAKLVAGRIVNSVRGIPPYYSSSLAALDMLFGMLQN